MDEAIQRITEGLKKAIQLEGDGYNFYRMAANGTSDPKGREVFDMLAREEAEHARFLRIHYESFLKTGKADPDAKLSAHVTNSEPHPVFSEKIRENISEAHLEMSALAIGIQLELNSIKYYQQQEQQHADPSVKQFFHQLVEWEQGHYNLFSRQQSSLKEDYWAAGGFSPF
ncbi:MAG: ferritin family protein [bacterium]